MTEQEPLAALKEAEPAIEPRAQKPAKKTTSQSAQKPAKKSSSKTSAVTEEEKRLTRNAALREWRKKNKDRVKSYMTEWRAKRSGNRQPALSGSATVLAAAPKPTPTKTKPSKKNTKQSKKGRKA